MYTWVTRLSFWGFHAGKLNSWDLVSLGVSSFSFNLKYKKSSRLKGHRVMSNARIQNQKKYFVKK